MEIRKTCRGFVAHRRSWVPLSVDACEHRRQRLADGERCQAFRWDEDDLLTLAALLAPDDLGYLGIDLRQRIALGRAAHCSPRLD